MYEIEKGMPIPEIQRPRRPINYPWKEMQIGDSFFIPLGVTTRNAIALSAEYQGRTTEKRFTIRTVEGGVRVWRVE